MRRKRIIGIVLTLVIAAIVYYRDVQSKQAPPANDGRAGAPPGETGDSLIEQSIRAKRSGVWVEAAGEVVHLLPDDRSGDKHQRFLLDLPSGHTIKISHNIDLAERLPLRKGDRLRFRGRFEWNAKGGVVHWTHHDPSGRKPGGWLELRGKRYR